MLQLEQSTNLQVSDKGQTDYSHGMLCLNSNCQIWACVVKYRRETSMGSSKKRLLANSNLYFMLKSHYTVHGLFTINHYVHCTGSNPYVPVNNVLSRLY